MRIRGAQRFAALDRNLERSFLRLNFLKESLLDMILV